MQRLSLFISLCLLLLTSPSIAGVSCDGVNDKVALDLESLYDCTNATCTVDFWLNAAVTTADNRHFLSKAGVGTGWMLNHSGAGTALRMSVRDSGGGNAAVRLGATTLIDAVWHHVMVVFTTSTTVSATNDITIYIDGVLSQASIARDGTFYSPNNNNVEMCHNTVNGNFTQMIIDDVRMYSGALSAAEALQRYKSRTRFTPTQGTQLFYFPMNTCVQGAAAPASFVTRNGNGTLATVTEALCGHYPQLMHSRGVE